MQETQETWVWTLGREDPLEEGLASHSSILGWKIPWTEETSGLWSIGPQKVRHDCTQHSAIDLRKWGQRGQRVQARSHTSEWQAWTLYPSLLLSCPNLSHHHIAFEGSSTYRDVMQSDDKWRNHLTFLDLLLALALFSTSWGGFQRCQSQSASQGVVPLLYDRDQRMFFLYTREDCQAVSPYSLGRMIT